MDDCSIISMEKANKYIVGQKMLQSHVFDFVVWFIILLKIYFNCWLKPQRTTNSFL